MTTRYNDAFINLLGELYTIMVRKGEPFRAKAYQKAQETVIGYPKDITEVAQMKGLPGIGDTILSKFDEFVQTGTLTAIEREKTNPLNLLTHVYGIGPKKAKSLVDAGITSIADLRLHTDLLTAAQKAGLKYYDDIQLRIPRSEIDEFKGLFADIFNKATTSTGASFEIVGSYRRGAANSGDIDIIITNKGTVGPSVGPSVDLSVFNPVGVDLSVFDPVLDVLIKDNIIVELLSRGKTKSLTIVRIKPDLPARRVDFLYTPPDEYAFALLYFTGSKIFNTVVRQRALDMGYTLNEHGLSHFKGGVKGAKVDHAFPDERSILEFLGIQYRAPEERTDGRSVVLLSAAQELEEPVSKKIETDVVKTDLAIQKSVKNVKSVKKNKTFKKPITVSTMDLIAQFKSDGLSFLKLRTEKDLTEMLQTANQHYYCEDNLDGPILNDNVYDILREYTMTKYPENAVAKEGHASCGVGLGVGVGVGLGKNKVALPYELWSMDKIKPTSDAVVKWSKTFKGPYVVSAKLDGISALYVAATADTPAKLYTRGNGTVGQDISHLIPHLIRENPRKAATIRGEIIIAKKRFAAKYATQFANPRNFVAGVVNKKTVDPAVLDDLDFVSYEVIEPRLKPSQQLQFLEKYWSVTDPVLHTKLNAISNEVLSGLLLKWRDQCIYEIDGVIVVNDAVYPRPAKNPDYAFAFKMVMGDQVAEVKVVDVIWTASKDGYMKPRVQIEPVVLSGVTIEYATGFNAKFIEENRIGVGALISIVRSGDVIPHILGVVMPAETIKWPVLAYEWNATHVDIMLTDKADDATVLEKNIAGFFKGIEVDGLGPGNIKKIIAAGFDSVPKIVAMTKADLLTVDGFKEKTAEKLWTGIKTRISKASLVDLMTASNIFGRGFGERRFTEIFKIQPDILTSADNVKEKNRLLILIDGIGEKTADQFVQKIPEFLAFLEAAGLSARLEQHEQAMEVADMSFGHPLYGKRFVLTGFRDKALMDTIKTFGGVEASTVSKTTDFVLVKDADADRDTGKAAQAIKLGIPIMTKAEFDAKYLNIKN